jgi:bacteriorhodopsin
VLVRINSLRFFCLLSGLLLLLTAIAKLVSSFGSTIILDLDDPILKVSYRHVFWVVGGVELLVAYVCFFGKNRFLQAGLVASLATTFLIYRIGLVWIGYHKPCACLGSVTAALHISPETADTIMKFVLAYLLISSCIILFILSKKRKDTLLSSTRSMPNKDSAVTTHCL